jgi:alpha-tubulin suppressor-like RCC1 family protein
MKEPMYGVHDCVASFVSKTIGKTLVRNMKIHTAGSNTTGELGVQSNENNFLVHTEIVAEEELYTYDSIKLVPSFGRYNLIWAENYDGSQALFMTGELNESKKFKQIDITTLNGERILQVAPGFHHMFVLTGNSNI